MKPGIIKILLLMCFMGCCCHFPRAQPALLPDSLSTAIKNAKDDTSRVNIFIELTHAHISIDAKQAIAYIEEGYQLAKTIKWEKGIATAARYYGFLLMETGDKKNAAGYLDESLQLSKQTGDKRGIILGYYNIGVLQQHSNNYSTALTNYFRGLQLAEEEKSPLVAKGYTLVSAIHAQQNNFKVARDYGIKAALFYKESNNEIEEANTLETIGFSYIKELKTDSAKNYYLEALALYKKAGHLVGEGRMYFQLQGCYNHDPVKQLEYIYRSKKILDENAPSSVYSVMNVGNLGSAYALLYMQPHLQANLPDSLKKNTGNFDQWANTYLKKGIELCRQTGALEGAEQFLKTYAELQSHQKNYKGALESFMQYQHLHDSLFSQENKNNIAALEGQREIELKDNQLKLNALLIENSKTQRFVLIAGLVLLSVIGAMFYYQSKNRKKNNDTLLLLNNELDQANKIKAKFFAILSHDLRSPIANIVTHLQLQGDKTGEISESLLKKNNQAIQSSAANLLDNMDTLLMWAKDQMDNYNPVFKPVEISGLFDSLKKSMVGVAGIHFSFIQPEGLLVITDINYLQTIMYNLTANAVKALQHTSGAMIEWKAVEYEGKTILSIADNGPGISDADAQKLWTNSPGPNHKQGFGLQMVKDLAKSIHCEISMQTEAGKGTCFSLAI